MALSAMSIALKYSWPGYLEALFLISFVTRSDIVIKVCENKDKEMRINRTDPSYQPILSMCVSSLSVCHL